MLSRALPSSAGKPSSGININREDNEAYEVDKKVAEVERVDEVTNLWECQDLAEVDKNRSSSTNNNDSLEPNIYNESKEICLDNKMKGKIKGHKGSKKTLSNNNKDKASASKNKLQDLPKDCDIMPEIARSLKLDESYRVALSAYGYIGVDIYIKYYQSAEIYYWNKAYNLGHRYRMGIHIEKGYK
ncbi:5750_t:CDS:2, partial [Gigaspora rosea]